VTLLDDRPTVQLGRFRPTRRALEFGVPAVVLLVAAGLRLWGLGDPHELVFDETYYVKDAWTLAHHGFETKWPDDANTAFNAGEPNGYLDEASYVVHPPLGKWIIALGMLLLGGDSSWGWRLSTALCGIVIVGLVYLLARRMVASPIWAGVAALFVAVDGTAIVMSRVALLDTPLTMFILLGAYFIIRDRQAIRSSYAAIPRHANPPVEYGPVLWRRPWVLAAGVAFGAACAVKWSGLYVLAGFGLYLVITDALERRRAGVVFWPTAAILRQGVTSFLLLVPIAAATYLVSWTGWLVTSGGWGRDGDANPLIALWDYHKQAYGFHVGLSSEHGYASPAWQWPLLQRPTSMYWNSQDCGPDGATYQCVAAISSLSNPLLWWGGMLAVLYLLYRFALRPDWRYAFVLTGIAVTYLPWLLFPERTIFQFYTVAMVPFVALATMLALRQLLANAADTAVRDDRRWRAMELSAWRALSATRIGANDSPDGGRDQDAFAWHGPATAAVTSRAPRTMLLTVVIAVGLVVIISAFFYPLWAGIRVPYAFWQLHMWLPTWI